MFFSPENTFLLLPKNVLDNVNFNTETAKAPPFQLFCWVVIVEFYNLNGA